MTVGSSWLNRSLTPDSACAPDSPLPVATGQIHGFIGGDCGVDHYCVEFFHVTRYAQLEHLRRQNLATGS